MKELAAKIIGMVFNATDTHTKKVIIILKTKKFQATIAAAAIACTYLIKRRMGKITKTREAESTFIKKNVNIKPLILQNKINLGKRICRL